jgi:integrase
MAVFKRGDTYWFEFRFNGQRIRKSTKQGNDRIARNIEAATRAALANGEVGIVERPRVPTLRDFEQRFIDEIAVRCADHPETIEFYKSKYAGLLRFSPLASAHLDRITEELIAAFVARQVKDSYQRATINRFLATLRRALRLANRWGLLRAVPRIELLSGENEREFILSREREPFYLAACPIFLRNWAEFAIETGLRRKELANLRWDDVRQKNQAHGSLVPIGTNDKAGRGFIRVRGTKSRNSKRTIALTARAQRVLDRQREISQCEYVFVRDTDSKQPASVSAVSHAHDDVRRKLEMPAEFVLHSLRHTFGTRLGEAGADAFTIMKLMGHSTITMSQRYVHPVPETMDRAIERMENAGTLVPIGSRVLEVPTVVPTARKRASATIN